MEREQETRFSKCRSYWRRSSSKYLSKISSSTRNGSARNGSPSSTTLQNFNKRSSSRHCVVHHLLFSRKLLVPFNERRVSPIRTHIRFLQTHSIFCSAPRNLTRMLNPNIRKENGTRRSSAVRPAGDVCCFLNLPWWRRVRPLE